MQPSQRKTASGTQTDESACSLLFLQRNGPGTVIPVVLLVYRSVFYVRMCTVVEKGVF